MQSSDEKQSPSLNSQLTTTLEIHIGEMLAEHERLMEEDREKAAHIAEVVHDLRGSLTSLNLRIYMLERGNPEQMEKYLAALKESVDELTKMADGLLAQVKPPSDD